MGETLIWQQTWEKVEKLIKGKTKTDREKPACNETETDVQVSLVEREMDGGMVGENTHARTFK